MQTMDNTETATEALRKFIEQLHGGLKADSYRRRDEVVELFLRLNPQYEFANLALLNGGEKFAVSRKEWSRLYRLEDKNHRHGDDG